MEQDGDRQKKMEGHCSTSQNSQRAVVPMEEEEGFHHVTARPRLPHVLNLMNRLFFNFNFFSGPW
jgi:hypothetical protein